jgi:hypothetical protein
MADFRARTGRRPVTPKTRKRRAAARLVRWWVASPDQALTRAEKRLDKLDRDRRAIRYYVLPRDVALLYTTDRPRCATHGQRRRATRLDP